MRRVNKQSEHKNHLFMKLLQFNSLVKPQIHLLEVDIVFIIRNCHDDSFTFIITSYRCINQINNDGRQRKSRLVLKDYS